MNGISPQPFDHFLQSVTAAQYDDYRRLPGAQVEPGPRQSQVRPSRVSGQGPGKVSGQFRAG